MASSVTSTLSWWTAGERAVMDALEQQQQQMVALTCGCSCCARVCLSNPTAMRARDGANVRAGPAAMDAEALNASSRFIQLLASLSLLHALTRDMLYCTWCAKRWRAAAISDAVRGFRNTEVGALSGSIRVSPMLIIREQAKL